MPLSRAWLCLLTLSLSIHALSAHGMPGHNFVPSEGARWRERAQEKAWAKAGRGGGERREQGAKSARPGERAEPGGWPMIGHTVDTNKWPLALCLNGEAPRYFVGKKPGAATDKQGWVLTMEGGGLCRNQKECTQRQRSFFGRPDPSTKSVSSGARPQGKLPDLVAEMEDYTRVYLHYCSGDLHAGDATVGSLHMRGRRIVEAVLDELLTKHGMDSASVLVVTGASAGGVGTYLNANYVASKVSSYGIKTVAVPRGGMLLYPAFEFEAGTFGMTVQEFFGKGGGLDRSEWQNQALDPGCWDAYGESGRFDCMFLDRFAQYLEVPTFLVYNRWDYHKYWVQPLTQITNDSQKKAAMKEWGDIHEHYFKQLIDGELPGINKTQAEQFGFFHAACMSHADVNEHVLVAGTSKGEAIGAWFRAQLKRWDLPGGNLEEPSKYQLIADAPGQAGKCSRSCCSSKCSQHIGCADDSLERTLTTRTPTATTMASSPIMLAVLMVIIAGGFVCGVMLKLYKICAATQGGAPAGEDCGGESHPLL